LPALVFRRRREICLLKFILFGSIAI